MRRLIPFVVLGAMALIPGEARAQYDNRSLGLGIGYLNIAADPTLSYGIPLSFETSVYMENHLDLTARIPVMILQHTLDDERFIGAGANVGLRYLFMDGESVRPYIGAELAFLYIFRDANIGTRVHFGVGPMIGVDIFTSDQFSIGPRAFIDFFLALNGPVRTASGLTVSVAWWF